MDSEIDGNDSLRDACGVVACILCEENGINVAEIVCLGLIGLQHRGQESAGIVTSNGLDELHFKLVRDHGLVNSVFTPEVISKLGSGALLGIGHTRYSTAGLKESINCIQPFVVYTAQGTVAVSHNGELVNARKTRNELLKKGIGLSTDVDSELIAQKLAWSAANHSLKQKDVEANGETKDNEKNGASNDDERKADWIDWIELMMKELKTTSYALTIMVKDRIFGVRDPWGNRPLCIGELVGTKSTLGWVLSSESTVFHPMGAKLIREVEPGEIVEITTHGITNRRRVPRPSGPPAFCIFEYVYFARADTIFEGQQVHAVRFKCGRQLGFESFVEADIVSTVPDSATPAALGYSSATGIPYTEVLCRNSYVGRTFIQPNTKMRQQGIMKKFGPIVHNFKDKRVVLVDDSIVRGNTMKQMVKLLKDAGAKEVHIRIASPPIKFPCYMGINIPTKEELIGHKVNVEQLSNFFGADSAVHLSVEGLVNAVQSGIDPTKEKGHCTACLTGKYPVSLDLDW